FSIASRLSNSSDILCSHIFRAPHCRGSSVAHNRFKGAWLSTNKSLAQVNNSPRWLRALSKKCIWTRELRKRQKKGSARPVTQSGRAEYRDIRPALLTGPSQQWLGLFPSMAATNKSLARTNKS